MASVSVILIVLVPRPPLVRIPRPLRLPYSPPGLPFCTNTETTVYCSVFQPGFRGTHRFRQFCTGFRAFLKLALFLVSRFRQNFNIVSKVPRLEKGWKALAYWITYARWRSMRPMVRRWCTASPWTRTKSWPSGRSRWCRWIERRNLKKQYLMGYIKTVKTTA